MPGTSQLLNWVIFLPLVGALLLLLFPRPADADHGHGHADGAAKPDAKASAVRWFAFAVAVVEFLASLRLLGAFQIGERGFQFGTNIPWVNVAQNVTVRYHVGIDGISLLLILLTTFLSMLAVLFSFNVTRRIREYMVFLLLLETAMVGVFCALDTVLFYVFWEAVLIPMYFLIGIWGHENRVYASIKFFLYTFAGSVLMLVGIIYIQLHTGTFDLVALSDPATEAHRFLVGLGPRTLMYLFAAFALAFMIKVPMFPFHTWLPDAHVEAPTAGSVILAGIMLKMGVYGFLRFCVPMFREQMLEAAPIFLALAVAGILYGAVVAAVQPDMKKLVAYSSVSHMGIVILGIFSFTPLGMMGAVLQSINHGVSTGMLFFLVGMLYDRRHTRAIAAFGGIKRVVPVLSAFFLIALFSSIALPLTNGFVGEFAVLQGSFIGTQSNLAAYGATGGMILSAVYMLWMFQRVFAGPVDKDENKALPDLSWRERIVLAPLVVLVFWFGCYVTSWTKYLNAPVEQLSISGNNTGSASAPVDSTHAAVAAVDARAAR